MKTIYGCMLLLICLPVHGREPYHTPDSATVASWQYFVRIDTVVGRQALFAQLLDTLPLCAQLIQLHFDNAKVELNPVNDSTYTGRIRDMHGTTRVVHRQPGVITLHTSGRYKRIIKGQAVLTVKYFDHGTDSVIVYSLMSFETSHWLAWLGKVFAPGFIRHKIQSESDAIFEYVRGVSAQFSASTTLQEKYFGAR